MVKEFCKKIVRLIKSFIMGPSIITGLNKIIDEQSILVNKLNDRNIEVFNNASDEILGKMYKTEVYMGNMKFWHNKKGIKTLAKNERYASLYEEVPVTFEGSNITYWWYFLKLEKEEE